MSRELGSSSQPLSSSHRLPTVSATQALERLRSSPAKVVATNLPHLDAILAQKSATLNATATSPNSLGFACGHVGEVYGPPGSGKTAFCLQVAASTLLNGHHVIWIDCGSTIPKDRLKSLFVSAGRNDADLQDVQQRASYFSHYTVADLAHLISMLLHRASDFMREATALLVIDDISTTFETTYARVNHQPPKKQKDLVKWYTSRKYATMTDLITKLQKLATAHHVTVLITQQTRMKIRTGAGALLLPVLSGLEWESAISTQLVLFRDFPPQTSILPRAELLQRWQGLRYIGVIKVNGILAEENGRFDTVVPFCIESTGLHELPSLEADITVPILSSPARATKRKFEKISDSEGDNDLESEDAYGFDEDLDFEHGLDCTTNTT